MEFVVDVVNSCVFAVVKYSLWWGCKKLCLNIDFRFRFNILEGEATDMHDRILSIFLPPFNSFHSLQTDEKVCENFKTNWICSWKIDWKQVSKNLRKIDENSVKIYSKFNRSKNQLKMITF